MDVNSKDEVAAAISTVQKRIGRLPFPHGSHEHKAYRSKQRQMQRLRAKGKASEAGKVQEKLNVLAGRPDLNAAHEADQQPHHTDLGKPENPAEMLLLMRERESGEAAMLRGHCRHCGHTWRPRNASAGVNRCPGCGIRGGVKFQSFKTKPDGTLPLAFNPVIGASRHE